MAFDASKGGIDKQSVSVVIVDYNAGHLLTECIRTTLP